MDRPGSRMPPLEWIRAFESAARNGSFTAAAAEMGLTQSAVSQRITHLERQLRTALFVRRARTIALTLEGEAWLPHVRTALDSLRDSSEALFGDGRQQMTISASHSIVSLWLLPRLDKIKAVSGGKLSVQTMVLGAHEAAQDDLIRVRYGSGNWPHKHAVRLFDEAITPLAAPQLLENTDHWTSLPRITCAGPRPGWNTWTSRFNIPSTPLPDLRFDTFSSALAAAEAGLGVLLGSLPLCATALRNGTLVRLSDDILHHHETYWVLAGPDAIARADWHALSIALQ